VVAYSNYLIQVTNFCRYKSREGEQHLK